MSGWVERVTARHPGVRVEHPREVWTYAAGDDAVDTLVDALVRTALVRTALVRTALVRTAATPDGATDAATLLVSNVTVPDPGDVHREGAWVAPGDYVALTVERSGWEISDSAWRPQGPGRFVDATLDTALRAAGAVFAYTRGSPRPSATCYLPRAEH